MAVWRSLLHLLLVVLACCMVSLSARADKRVALVVGNSAYQHVSRLPNPANDASAVSALLQGLGFAVKQVNEAGRHELRDALAEFSNTAMGADVAIVYYAGHGMEMDRENYLIPVDAELATDLRVRFEAIPLDDVLGALDGAKGLRIVLLDACRNNPFLGAMRVTAANRAISRGLSRVEPSVGTLISFAAKEGTLAADGTTQHSPYTTALLAHLDQPGIEINKLFRLVRDDVLAATGGAQEPYTYGSTSGQDMFLKPPPAAIATAPSGASVNSAGESVEADQLLWRQLASGGDEDAIDSFIRAYPTSKFRGDADAKLGILRTARLDSQIQTLSGNFYSRNGSLKLRKWAGRDELISGTAVADEAMTVLGRLSLTSGSDAAKRWYKLKLATGEVGYADEDAVINQKGHDTSKYWGESAQLMGEILQRAKSENSGPYARYSGVYVTGEYKECINEFTGDLRLGVIILVWFSNSKAFVAKFYDPHDILTATVSPFTTIQKMRFYTFRYSSGSKEVLGFGSGNLYYSATFTKKNTYVTYHTGKSCGYMDTVVQRAIDQTKENIRKLDAEASE